MVCLGNKQRLFCHFWDCIKHCILDYFIDSEGYFIFSKGFLTTVVDIMVIWVKFTQFKCILVHWFLECWSSSCHLLFDHFQFALIHGPNIPGSYAILFFTASDLASITSHIHNWVLVSPWLYHFILPGVISPLFFSSILVNYQPEEFIFQCTIFLLSHPAYGVLKARILKWFAIPFSNGPNLAELSTITHPWVTLHSMAHSFIELDKAVAMWSVW